MHERVHTAGGAAQGQGSNTIVLETEAGEDTQDRQLHVESRDINARVEHHVGVDDDDDATSRDVSSMDAGTKSALLAAIVAHDVNAFTALLELTLKTLDDPNKLSFLNQPGTLLKLA